MEKKITETKSLTQNKVENIGKIWFQNNGTMLLKFPKGFDEQKLPIRLERSMALVIKDDCVELRNLAVQE